MNREILFPEDIKFHKDFLREVEEAMKKKGCIEDDQYVYQAELQKIFRFKYDPMRTKSAKYICMAETVVELLDKKLKENPNRKDIAELRKVFEYWLRLNKSVRKEVADG